MNKSEKRILADKSPWGSFFVLRPAERGLAPAGCMRRHTNSILIRFRRIDFVESLAFIHTKKKGLRSVNAN